MLEHNSNYNNKITSRSVKNENKNYFRTININKWKNKKKKFEYNKGSIALKIIKKEIDKYTANYIQNDQNKLCDLCNIREIHHLNHIFFKCGNKLIEELQRIKSYCIEKQIECNMNNLLYPLESEILNSNNKNKVKDFMEIRFELIRLVLGYYGNYIQQLKDIRS